MSRRPIRPLLFSTLYPSSVRPGHGIFVETRLRELLKSGEIETRVVAPVPWFPSADPRFGRYAAWARTPHSEDRHGITVVHPRYPVLPRIGMTVAPALLAAASIPSIQQLANSGFEFDLIDAHYFYPDGVAAAILGRYFCKPVAITARGSDLNLIARYAVPRVMMRWAARRAQASIGVSAALVSRLEAIGAAPDRLHMLRNGVDLQRFTPLPRDAMRHELGIGGYPLLLSVGNLTELKGHHVLIDALAALLPEWPQALLVIVGEGEERGALERQAMALGVGDRVRFTGAVEQDQLRRWYSAADALLLASSREGWANVLLEAMACGTPTVATCVGGNPEIVAPGSSGLLVATRDGPSFAAAVRRLLATRLDRASVRAYAERYGWESTSRAQLAIFERMLASPAPVAGLAPR